MMKRILFGCVGAGLAVGGAYLLYKRWQKYQQQRQEKNNEPTLKKSEHFNPNFDDWIPERDNGLSGYVVQNGANASNEGETETTTVHRTKDLDCQICHEESLKPENASAKENKTGQDVQRGQDLLSTLKKSEHFNPNFDKGILERDDSLSVCAVENGENSSNEGETETRNVYKTKDLDCQICHEESLKSENASAKENKTGQDVQRGQDLLLTFKKSKDFNPNLDKGIMERDDCLSVCAVENGENSSNEGETETTNVYKTEDLDCQICHEESLKSENASAKENETGQDVQCGQDLLSTFKKSEHFNPNFDEGIMDRDDGLSICAVENDEKASTKGEAETTNVYNTEDLDCQICHEKPLKSENASAKENNTGHDVQRGQDLPLTADAALNNTLNMSDANFSISGPNFFKIPIEGIDEDVLYKEVNEFFASLFKEAGRVSQTDSEQTTLEAGQMFQAGSSSHSSSPSTSGFDPNPHDQPNGAGTKKASKQLANRRHRTRKHKKY